MQIIHRIFAPEAKKVLSKRPKFLLSKLKIEHLVGFFSLKKCFFERYEAFQLISEFSFLFYFEPLNFVSRAHFAHFGSQLSHFCRIV